MERPITVARVVPDVTGLDKEFDYLVPEALVGVLSVGDRVRVPLHGRRVGGWVVRLGAIDPAVPVARLLPVYARSGLGPDEGLVALAEWTAHRWAGRRRAVLVTASPLTMVKGLPAPSHTVARPTTSGDVTARLLRRPPTANSVDVVIDALSCGPTLVVAPNLFTVGILAARLRRIGRSVAVVPEQWARAAAGVDVVIGARSAAWARCGPLGSIVLLDEHDEALQEERNPTWHAREVLAERARRLGVPFVVVSPCPTVVAIAAFGPAERPSRDDERAGWPIVEVVDRTEEEPWRSSLVTSALQHHLRDPRRRVVCVLNTKGRARLLACVACRELQRCERCQAAVGQDDDGSLVCRRCGETRPTVCPACGASSMRLLRLGVTRLREELEAAAQRPVVAVEGSEGHDPLPDAGVYVGTEAVLHRVHQADVVAFVDLDAELLAPRYRAAEQAMALLARAARMVGPRSGGGRILVQTFLPHHEVLRAVLLADPARLSSPEMARREMLGFPPAAALATMTGVGADQMADCLRAFGGDLKVQGPADGTYLVRAPTWDALADALAATPRPPRSRVRVEVDPPRL